MREGCGGTRFGRFALRPNLGHPFDSPAYLWYSLCFLALTVINPETVALLPPNEFLSPKEALNEGCCSRELMKEFFSLISRKEE
jgi:hypothetical protein